MTGVFPAGFPHSEICGSMDICSSPQLIAAYHVFHRLSVPRHPPCALIRLTFRPCTSVYRVTVLSWFSLNKNFSKIDSRLSVKLILSRLFSSLKRKETFFKIFNFCQCVVFKVQMIISFFHRLSMEIRRFELLTPCLQGRCSPN